MKPWISRPLVGHPDKNSGLVFHIREPDLNGYVFYYHQANQPEYIVGRVPNHCDFSQVQVQLRDKHVSRRHCRIFWSAHGWMVEDLNSSNGTAVSANGKRAERLRCISGPIPIAAGSTIRVGRTVLTITEKMAGETAD